MVGHAMIIFMIFWVSKSTFHLSGLLNEVLHPWVIVQSKYFQFMQTYAEEILDLYYFWQIISSKTLHTTIRPKNDISGNSFIYSKWNFLFQKLDWTK